MVYVGRDSGFDAEPVIGPANRPDLLASPRNDEDGKMLFTADHDEPRRILQKFIAADDVVKDDGNVPGMGQKSTKASP